MLANLTLSLTDLLGKNYLSAVVAAQAALTGTTEAALWAIADRKVEFYPPTYAAHAERLAKLTGQQLCRPMVNAPAGAATKAFAAAQHSAMAPLACLGCTRIGEDGRAYFTAKSEHYHISLGHKFPGYELLTLASQLGIVNATHNNTRGFITRKLERELVRVANGIALGDQAALTAVIASPDERALNRVINLETGSLAVESALKMLLARFYRLDQTYSEPPYAGRTPVFLVMADFNGNCEANYHGTTILTQILRGMWPELKHKLAQDGLYQVVPVAINDFADFATKVAKFDAGPSKVAGFFHELVLMNYGGIRLTENYVQRCHALAREHDIPTMVDEIQSCMWSPELFLFKEYGITPDFVSVGKGFPGGEYPASKIITNAKMDTLNQFGALVTNGQEELASLAYLVTMAFAEHNRDHTATVGKFYQQAARALAKEFPAVLEKIAGNGLLTSFVFRDSATTQAFVRFMNDRCYDVSAQTYKANCPPVALTKLPLVVSESMITQLIDVMREGLQQCM